MNWLKSNRISKFVVIAVFICILLTGLSVFDDYGVSTDEPIQHRHSLISYRTLARIFFDRDVFSEAGPMLNQYMSKHYGVAIQLPLVFAEDMYQVATGEQMSMDAVYRMRHLYTFLVYYLALLCFYFLNKQLFASRWVALAGTLMVYLFGRFFAQSFYNIKDMVFASLMMIVMLCAHRVFSSERKPLWCLLFAISGAFLVSSRIVGALIIIFVILIMLVQDLTAHRNRPKDTCKKPGIFKRLLPYLLVCSSYPIWLLITPASWTNPIDFSLGYVGRFANFETWKDEFAFAGRIINQDSVPRSYFITWMALTVPIVNQLLCLFGIGHFCLRSQRDKVFGAGKPILWISLLILVSTLGYQIIRQTVAYNGWRHVFYLYPLIVLFATYGLHQIMDWSRLHRKVWLQAAAIGCVVGSLAFNALQIVKNHPYQYAMFNIVGQRYAGGFERDYWWMSTPTLANWLLENCDEDKIRISYFDEFVEEPYIIDQRILQALPPEKTQRFEFCYTEDADYVIVNYNSYLGGNDKTLEGFEEIHAAWVDQVKLAAVMKRVS